MNRPPRAVLLAALLAAFGALLGCGQRGPLTLPGAAKPIERLDPSKAAPASGGGAPSTSGAETASPDAAPRPEDEERRKSQ